MSRVIAERVRFKGQNASKPIRKTRSLTLEQFHALLETLGTNPSWRTLLLLAVSFGLRISEVLGLRWCDVDWLGKTLSVERAVVKQICDDVKSTHSARKMVCADELLEVLNRWRQITQFSGQEDWVFASPYKLGRQPISYTFVWESLRNAARQANIGHVRSIGRSRRSLAIVAVEEIAHRPSPSFIRFHQSLAFVCVHDLLG